MFKDYPIERIDYKKSPSQKRANEMILWGKIMGILEMAPYVKGKGWAGNIGFRENDIIWVTSSGCEINDIKLRDIVGIAEKNNQIYFFGDSSKMPTSEWEIHFRILNKRPETNVILHGHDVFALETAENLSKSYPETVALTKNITGSGSPEFRKEILKCLTDSNSYLIGKEHGFFSLGKNFEQAGTLALNFRTIANKLMVGEGKYSQVLNKYHIG